METAPAYNTVTAVTAAAIVRGANHASATESTRRNGTIGQRRTPQPTRLDREIPSRSTSETMS